MKIAERFANLECRVADTRQKYPRTIHHRRLGNFAIDGTIIKLRSKMP